MRRKLVIITVLGVAVAAVVGALAVTHRFPFAQSVPPAPPQIPPVPVVAALVATGDVPIYAQGIGTVLAYNTVVVRSQIQGQITQINFKEGQAVRAGDLLAQIDPRPYQAQLDSAEATLARNRAELELARVELARVEQLIRTDAISKQEYDSRRSTVAIDEAQVRQTRAAVETAKLNLDYCFIRSPIDGRAGQRLVDLGNVVGPGAPGGLLVIQRLDPMYADFTIPENDLTSVQRSIAAGHASVEVRLPDDPDKPRTGTLTFLDNAVQDGTGTVKLRATVANPDWRFWPGRFVKVRLVLGTHKGAVLVPATATQTSAKGPFVYVVKDDSTAELRPVSVGQRQGDQVAITSGLKGGERVVTAGQLGVTPGGKVRFDEKQARNDSASAAREARNQP
jgi:multidrug efflux system membrane fusion protein